MGKSKTGECQTDITIDCKVARDGINVLEISRQGKKYQMNSIYNASNEAERYARQFDNLGDNYVLMVFGYGNGVFPHEIMNVCGNKGVVVFYEPTQAIYQKMSDNYEDAGELLGKIGYLIMPEIIREEQNFLSVDEFPGFLENVIDYSNCNNVRCVALPKYKDIFPDEYAAFLDCIQFRIQFLQSNVATAKKMGCAAVINNIKNLQYIPICYCADSFVGKFPVNSYAIIVSAGPSLEKNVQELKRAKGHALIIAVDSAVRYLLDECIMPDLILSVDPEKPLNRFEDARIDGIPIVGSTDMNYRILEMLPESKVIFAKTENSYVQSLLNDAGHKIECLKSGGSVANVAFSLCLYWGFRYIILVGQDLALTDERMYAGNGTEWLEQSKAMNPSSVNNSIKIQDVNDNDIYTTKEYYHYLKWFEQVISDNPEVRVIDATEGGAKIVGSEIMSLNEAISLCDGADCDFRNIIEKTPVAFEGEHKEIVSKRIKDSEATLLKLQNKMEDGITLSGRAIRLVRQGDNNFQKYQIFDRELQEICDFYEAIEEDFYIQRQIDATCLEEFMMLFDNSQIKSQEQKYQRMEKYFTILRDATKAVSEIWSAL